MTLILPTFDDVAKASEILKGVAHRTPVLTSRTADSQTGAKFYTYNQGNSILMAGGAILFLIGVFGATSANADAANVQAMKTDPFFHFNDMKFTEEKINDFNTKLKVTLGINF